MKRQIKKNTINNSNSNKKRRISSDIDDSDDDSFIVDDNTIEFASDIEEITETEASETEKDDETETEKEDEEDEGDDEDEEGEEDEEDEESSDSDIDIDTYKEEIADYNKFLKKLKKKDKETYEKFMEIKEYIDESLPEITDIIRDKISVKNKARIVELYEVFKMSEPLTEEWILLKDRINTLVSIYREEYININSKIDIKHKILLMEKYEIFSTLVPFSEDWFDLKNRLNVLTKQFIKEYEETKNVDEDKIEMELEKLEQNTLGSDSILSTKERIIKLKCSKENKVAIYKRWKEMRPFGSSEENNKLKKWIDCAIELPFDKLKKLHTKRISKFIKEVSEKLDKELYGMDNVKEQLLIFLNTKLNNPSMKGCSIALLGPPGVGKTTIARLLAKVMNWPFEQISFGGVSNSDFLKGHDYTYVGSRPGEIVRCLTRMQYKNGILFFDEYEKVADNKGIVSTLLHITDFQQNHEFVDNYLCDLKLDLSNLWFIYSMNNIPTDSALRDRLFIIQLEGYNLEEKVRILIDFVLPKLLKNIGLKGKDITMNEETARNIIEKYDKDEKGIRNLENIIREIINKINFVKVNYKNLNDIKSITFKDFEKVQYPIEITTDMINKLMKERDNIETKFAKPPFGMYL